MLTKDIVVNNQVGLHARPATFFIQKANEYRCGIWVERDDRRVNAKSLLGVLSLGITKGSTIRLIADGSDEQLAIDELQINFLSQTFCGDTLEIYKKKIDTGYFITGKLGDQAVFTCTILLKA